MAVRRMFSQTVVSSDAFLDLPLSSQALYFHLGMRADDDGFINNPRTIMRLTGANQNDLDLLIAKSFLLNMGDGIMVVKHWQANNYIQKDRYKPTEYKDKKRLLYVKDNRIYTLDPDKGRPVDTLWIQDVHAVKLREVKESQEKEESSKEEPSQARDIINDDIESADFKRIGDLIFNK